MKRQTRLGTFAQRWRSWVVGMCCLTVPIGCAADDLAETPGSCAQAGTCAGPSISGEHDPLDDCSNDAGGVIDCHPDMDLEIVAAECAGGNVIFRLAFASPVTSTPANGALGRSVTIHNDDHSAKVTIFAHAQDETSSFNCQYFVDGSQSTLPPGASCEVNVADGTFDFVIPAPNFDIRSFEVFSSGYPSGDVYKSDEAGPFDFDCPAQ